MGDRAVMILGLRVGGGVCLSSCRVLAAVVVCGLPFDERDKR